MIPKLPPKQAIAFTDAAYSKNKNRSSFGVVLFTSEGKEIYDKVFRWENESHKEIIKLHNVAAECEAALFAVKKSIEKGIKRLTIFYDYEGILKWLNKSWVANTTYSQNYVKAMTKYSKHVIIGFSKVKSHIGIIYNELADEIATNALLKP